MDLVENLLRVTHKLLSQKQTVLMPKKKQIENYKTLAISKHLSFNRFFIIFILEFLNSFITVPKCIYEKLWELERF